MCSADKAHCHLHCIVQHIIDPQNYSMCPGWCSECSALCSCCGGLLHLSLASGPLWRAVWTQGLVQHRGWSCGPSTHDGWWDTGITLCHTAGRTNGGWVKTGLLWWELDKILIHSWMWIILLTTKHTQILNDTHREILYLLIWVCAVYTWNDVTLYAG